jgi:hypothetical protein
VGFSGFFYFNYFPQLEPLAKFHGEGKKRQGTTSVVPPVQQEDVGL